MSKKPFRFKQFEILQDKTAMKVGTDGVLLGAWANLYKGKTILDVGTGTGLISLMLAQRFTDTDIDAVEIDHEAYLQAKSNFENSTFSSQLSIYESSFQDYSAKRKYDLIVSNPPFFTVNNLVDFDQRKQARQQETLNFDDLIHKTASLLNDTGSACFIIPYDQCVIFTEISSKNKLKLNKTLYIKGNNTSPIKRVLLEFSFQERETIEETLIIEEERHQYTQNYIELTKDFYLKM